MGAGSLCLQPPPVKCCLWSSVFHSTTAAGAEPPNVFAARCLSEAAVDSGKSRGNQGCEFAAAFPHQHLLGEHNGGWSWTRDAGGDGRGRIQPQGPHPAAGTASSHRGKPLPRDSSRFDPSPSIVRVFTAWRFVLAMQELAAEDGDGMQQPMGGSGSVSNRLGCVVYPGMSPPAGDMGSAEAYREHRWGWQSAAAFLAIRLLGSRREILPLGNLPCAACGVLYLWAERKHSLLHIISLDQQEKSHGLGRDCRERR